MTGPGGLLQQLTKMVVEALQQVLPTLAGRARAFAPGIQVIVDVSGADHIEAAAVDLLRWAIDHDHLRYGQVGMVLPEPPPCHLATVASPDPAMFRRPADLGGRPPAAL